MTLNLPAIVKSVGSLANVADVGSKIIDIGKNYHNNTNAVELKKLDNENLFQMKKFDQNMLIISEGVSIIKAGVVVFDSYLQCKGKEKEKETQRYVYKQECEKTIQVEIENNRLSEESNLKHEQIMKSFELEEKKLEMSYMDNNKKFDYLIGLRKSSDNYMETYWDLVKEYGEDSILAKKFLEKSENIDRQIEKLS